MFYGKIHYKLPFSIAMFVYQRVNHPLLDCMVSTHTHILTTWVDSGSCSAQSRGHGHGLLVLAKCCQNISIINNYLFVCSFDIVFPWLLGSFYLHDCLFLASVLIPQIRLLVIDTQWHGPRLYNSTKRKFASTWVSFAKTDLQAWAKNTWLHHREPFAARLTGFSCLFDSHSPPARWGLLDFIRVTRVRLLVLFLVLFLVLVLLFLLFLPPPPPRGHCRTSSASSRSQWATPVLNGELR